MADDTTICDRCGNDIPLEEASSCSECSWTICEDCSVLDKHGDTICLDCEREMYTD